MNIAQQRLNNQRIIGTNFTKPQEVVAHLGAMQAQDYPMSKWAVGLRTQNATDQTVEQALDEGLILRTHILRPTWHLVAAQDIRWMLALTAPHIHQISSHYNRKAELSDTLLNRTDELLAKILAGQKHLTKAELMEELAMAGINTSAGRDSLILIHAELNGVLCNGKRYGKQTTYALLDERVAPTPAYSREEALGMLARRYFQSHGPATVHDFTWWSGLKVSDARIGLELVKSEFITETIDSHSYLLPTNTVSETSDTAFLLPAFDEFMVSYKNRAASLDTSLQPAAITANGIFKPIIVINGKVEGLWSRTIQKEKVAIETIFFQSHFDSSLISNAIKNYAFFLQKEIA